MSRVLFGVISALLLDLLVGAFVLSMPYAAQSLNAGNLGTVANTLWGVVYFAVCFAGSRGRLFPERRHILVAGALTFSAACFLFMAMKTPATVVLCAALGGAGTALYFPTLQAWFTEGMEKPRIVGAVCLYTVCWVSGLAIGPSVAGYLLQSAAFGPDIGARLTVLFAALGALSCAAGLLLIPDWYRRPAAEGRPPAAVPEILSQEIPPGVSRFFLHLIWVALFLSTFEMTLMRLLFTEIGKAEKLGSFLVGNINSLMFASMIAAVLFLWRRTFWLFSFRTILFFQSITLPALFFFMVTRNVALYCCGGALMGLYMGFAFISSAFYSLTYRGIPDKYISLNEAIIGLSGVAAGSLGIVSAAAFSSIKFSFLPGIVILVLCFAAEGLLFSRRPALGQNLRRPASVAK